MLEYMLSYFKSWFIYPGVSGQLLLIGVGLALVFGAVWFAPYWTPILKKPWSWAVLAGSAFLTFFAICFIQIPLQWWTGDALAHFFSQQALTDWILVAVIPQALIGGLVQEGAKLVPVVIYWWRKGRNIDPKLALAIGAVAGLGFGIFEAQWAHNTLFSYGWSWEMVQAGGLVMLAGFWERFFAVAFHIASCALAGWGLAKGWGWQSYLIVSLLHAILNYLAVPFNMGLLTVVWLEVFIAIWAVLVASAALWIRWMKVPKLAESEVSSDGTSDTESS